MAKIQDNPQSQSYTKKADKKKTAKPVGARFTNKLAKRLGKKNTTKPSASDIEKYLGKGVYKEKRKDKSDLNPKDKFAKGGQASPQSGSYTTRADKKKTAKPVGVRFTDKLANRLGKKPTTKPTLGEAEKYMGKGVYKENRKDKSDINPKNRFAKGGTTQTYAQYPKTYNEFRDITKEAKPVGYRYTDALAKRLGVNPLSKPSNAHVEKYLDKGVYWENRADKSDQNRKDKLAKGGNVKETRVYAIDFSNFDEDENVNSLSDEKFMDKAEEYGHVYTLKGFQQAVNNDEINMTYLAIRFIGGDTEYARGGKLSKSKILDLYKTKKSFSDSDSKMIDEAIENGYIDTDDIKEDFMGFLDENLKADDHSFSDEEIFEYTDEHYENGKTHHENYRQFLGKKDGKYARGGQAPSYKETYFGNKWTRKADKEEKGKRVGYRYTDKLAKRLGVNKYAKPTDVHIEKYLGNGIYFENRKDKSDVSPKDKLAKGGTTQTYPQSQSYNEFRDIQKDAKPVGYRYTDKLAKRLGVNVLAKPSKAHIDKYLDKGVYWENRADKSDQNRKDKLEDGGEMAKGGQARISNSEASSYAENHQPFKGNNLESKTLENGDYVVLSYGYYPIWYWNKKENKWYQNKEKFSQTTARHITASRPTYDAQVVTRNEMDNMMAKSLEGNGFMALGGELSSFVVSQ